MFGAIAIVVVIILIMIIITLYSCFTNRGHLENYYSGLKTAIFHYI